MQESTSMLSAKMGHEPAIFEVMIREHLPLAQEGNITARDIVTHSATQLAELYKEGKSLFLPKPDLDRSAKYTAMAGKYKVEQESETNDSEKSAKEYYFDGVAHVGKKQYQEGLNNLFNTLDTEFKEEASAQLIKLFLQGIGLHQANLSGIANVLMHASDQEKSDILYRLLIAGLLNNNNAIAANLALIKQMKPAPDQELILILLKETVINNLPGALRILADELVGCDDEIKHKWQTWLEKAADELRHPDAAYAYGKIRQKNEANSKLNRAFSSYNGAKYYFHIAAAQGHLMARKALIELGDTTYTNPGANPGDVPKDFPLFEEI